MVWSQFEHHLETVKCNPKFWDEMKEKIDTFYLELESPSDEEPKSKVRKSVRLRSANFPLKLK